MKFLEKLMLSVGLGILAPALVHAQPVTRIVIGFPAGGGVDAVARLLADGLRRLSGENYVVESKTGAGGVIAVQSMLTAPRDATVLLLAPDSTIVIYPHTVAAPGFDAIADLVPVSGVASYDLAFTVKADPNVADLDSFIRRARADPKAASFASPAAGSLQHFYGLSIAQGIGVPLLHVPYRGVAPAVTDTIGGVVASVVTPVGAVLQHAKSGTLRILATSGEQRGAATSQVPTFKELGYPQLAARGWFGLFAPAGTPVEAIDRINGQIRTLMQSADFTAKLTALDMESRWTSAREFANQVRTESQSWAQIVKRSGFTADK